MSEAEPVVTAPHEEVVIGPSLTPLEPTTESNPSAAAKEVTEGISTTRQALYTLIGTAIALPSWYALVSGHGHGTGYGQLADLSALTAALSGTIAALKHGMDLLQGSSH